MSRKLYKLVGSIAMINRCTSLAYPVQALVLRHSPVQQLACQIVKFWW